MRDARVADPSDNMHRTAIDQKATDGLRGFDPNPSPP
jgi:hypothetical protein